MVQRETQIVNKNINAAINFFISNIRSKFHVSKIVLFGSYSKNNNTDFSDIDIAIVSSDFSGIRFYDVEKIIESVDDYDSRIEIHPFTVKDFEDETPFIKEIKKTGIELI